MCQLLTKCQLLNAALINITLINMIHIKRFRFHSSGSKRKSLLSSLSSCRVSCFAQGEVWVSDGSPRLLLQTFKARATASHRQPIRGRDLVSVCFTQLETHSEYRCVCVAVYGCVSHVTTSFIKEGVCVDSAVYSPLYSKHTHTNLCVWSNMGVSRCSASNDFDLSGVTDISWG